MGQRAVKQKICDRCLKDTLASATLRFTVGDVEYEIDVCEKHADMFQRDISGWTRVAREKEKPTVFGRSSVEREAANRTRVERPQPRPTPTGAKHHPPIERPEVRVSWYLSQHAEERLEERGPVYGFERKDVFLAAQAPEEVAPHPHEEDRWIYVRGKVALILSRQSSTILTVMPAEWQNQGELAHAHSA